MRLLRACLLFAAAGAFTSPVPSAVRRQTILRAEEANVGTAVRNIAPWLLFVLVGPAPRPRLSPSRVEASWRLDDASPVDPTQSRRCASRTTRSASPRRATRPARTSCRRGRRNRRRCLHRVDGFTSTMASRRRRDAPQVLPVALRARHRRRRLTHGYVILGPTVHLRPRDVLLQPV